MTNDDNRVQPEASYESITPNPPDVSDSERRLRRLRLFDRFYGRDYSQIPLNVSPARRNSIAKGYGTPSFPELLAGAGFHSDDLKADLRRFCRIVLRYGDILRDHFNADDGDWGGRAARLTALDELLAEMRHAQFDCRFDAANRIFEALRKVKLHTKSDLYREAFGWPEFEHRLEFYMACANDSPAQAKIGRHCLDAARNGLVSGAQLRALTCAIAWFERSIANRIIPDADYLSGAEMLVTGSMFFSTISRDVKIEDLATLFFANRDELLELIKKVRALETIKPTGTTDTCIDERIAGDRVGPHGKPGLVVFTAVNSRESIGKIYKDLIGKEIPLIQAQNIVGIRQRLLTEFPHAKNVIDVLLRDAGNHIDRFGRPIIRIRPTMLIGDPGSGKSHFARKFGDVLGLPRLFFACAAVQDSMFGASNKKWSNGEPALPVERIALENVANLLIILDEIEKAGTRRDNGRLHDVILNMVEPSTAKEYFDQSLSATVNLSALNWVCTANSLNGISEPLRDRFRILEFPNPEVEHLPILLPFVLRGLSRERYGEDCWAEQFDEVEIEQIEAIWKGGSIRVLNRVVEAILDAREQHQRTMMI